MKPAPDSHAIFLTRIKSSFNHTKPRIYLKSRPQSPANVVTIHQSLVDLNCVSGFTDILSQ